MKHWSPSQIARLSRMRAGFLDGSAGRADYWEDVSVVELYDRTFGARIAWKWDAVLRELEVRGWRCNVKTLVDLGCGSGVGHRSVLAAWDRVGEGEGARRGLEHVVLMDRSAVARAYSAGRLRDWGVAPEATRLCTEVGQIAATDWEDALVLVSHVVSELSDLDLDRWVASLAGARALIWVEAGTREVSRRLVERVREPLRRQGWRAVAPCTHSGGCPMLTVEWDRHWCHHFATVPAEVHQDAAWRELSQGVEIDLRVLPYSFLVMESPRARPSARPLPGVSRVIGQAREFKGYLKVLSCAEDVSGDWMLQKRDAPGEFRRITRNRGPHFYRWEVEGNRIRSGMAAEGLGD